MVCVVRAIDEVHPGDDRKPGTIDRQRKSNKGLLVEVEWKDGVKEAIPEREPINPVFDRLGTLDGDPIEIDRSAGMPGAETCISQPCDNAADVMTLNIISLPHQVGWIFIAQTLGMRPRVPGLVER